MKLDHVAIWAVDIELMRTFYEKYFDARSNLKYENERKRFTSYFPHVSWRRAVGTDAPTRHPKDPRFTELARVHLGTHTWVWSWALGPPSTPLQSDCRATGSRFSMGQDGRATDTTRAWSRIPKVTGLSSPNELTAAPSPSARSIPEFIDPYGDTT